MKQQLRFFLAVAVAAGVMAATVFSAFAAEPGLKRLQLPPQALGASEEPAGVAAKCTKMTASEVTWATLTEDGEVDEEVEAYPAETTTLAPLFEYNCVPSKTTLVTVFLLNGETVFTDKETLKADTKKGTYLYPLSKKDESPMDEGEWEVQFFNNKTLLTSGTVELGGEAPDKTGVTVQGTVTDKKTKKPVKATYVFVLNPGVTVQDWVDAEFPDEDVFTGGVTDSKGKYVLESKLERKEKYALVIMAKGYKPVTADDFSISDKDPDPLILNVTLTK